MSQTPAPAAPARPSAGRGRNLELSEELKAYKGVWVFIEHDRGHVHSVSWELVGEARKLVAQRVDPLPGDRAHHEHGRPGECGPPNDHRRISGDLLGAAVGHHVGLGDRDHAITDPQRVQ